MEAISRKDRREILNFLKYPLGRPVSWHRLRSLIGEESLFILFNLIPASIRSSSLRFIFLTLALSSWRLFQLRLTVSSRRFCFSTEDFFAISVLISSLFFTSWAFLPLLSVWIFFVDNIKTAAAANELISLRRVSLDRCFHFHDNSFIRRIS